MIVPGAVFAPRRGFGPPIVTGPFPTTWPNTQNPVSLGTPKQGGADGLDWQNTQSTGGVPGIQWGTGSSPTDDTDCISCWPGLGISTTRHYSTITVTKVIGYTPPDSHEVENLVGWTIGAHSAKGYEFSWGWNSSSLVIARWNGALNDFTVGFETILSGTEFIGGTGANDGDVLKVIYDATSGSPIMTAFINGIQLVQVTDTTAGKIVSGSPGSGFFARPGTGLDMSKYCNRGLDIGNA